MYPMNRLHLWIMTKLLEGIDIKVLRGLNISVVFCKQGGKVAPTSRSRDYGYDKTFPLT